MKILKNKTILITGGTGSLGKALTKHISKCKRLQNEKTKLKKQLI